MSRCDLRRRETALFGILAMLTILFIWGNSCLSKELSGASSGVVTRFLRSIFDPNGKIPVEIFHHFVRKAAHFIEFAALGLFVGGFFLSLRAQKGTFVSLPILILLSVAVLDEYIQFFTGRGSAVTDVILDFCGALTGAAGSVLFSLLFNKTSHKK